MLDGNDCRQTFSEVVVGQVRIILFDEIVIFGVGVDDSRQCLSESIHMRAAVRCEDIVTEGIDLLGIGSVVAKGNFHGDLGFLISPIAVQNIFKEFCFTLIQEFDIFLDTTFITEGVGALHLIFFFPIKNKGDAFI